MKITSCNKMINDLGQTVQYVQQKCRYSLGIQDGTIYCEKHQMPCPLYERLKGSADRKGVVLRTCEVSIEESDYAPQARLLLNVLANIARHFNSAK